MKKIFPHKAILITGASGFIGANLTRRLVRVGSGKVHIFVRSSSDKWRIKDILKSVEAHNVDLRDAGSVRKAVSVIRPKIIFHTATYGGYPFQKDQDKIIGTNVNGFLNLLIALAGSRYESLINLGSASEYGPKTAPMKENDSLTPSDIYGISKAAATMIAERERVIFKRPVTTIRPFSVYGPYEEKGRLIPYAVKNCIDGKDIMIKSPDSTRDFIYVDDAVEFMIEAASRGKGSGILNMGGGKTMTVKQAVRLIKKATGSKANIIFPEHHEKRLEPDPWVADMTKARKTLRWKPKTDFIEGIKKTAAWMEMNLKYYG